MSKRGDIEKKTSTTIESTKPLAKRLRELKELEESGLISNEDAAEKRKEILKGL